MAHTFFRLINPLYAAWTTLWFVGPLPLIALLHLVVKLWPEHQRLRIIYAVHEGWIRIWSLMTGIRFSVEGHHLVGRDQTYMFVANHSNLLDILLVGSRIRHPWKSLAKREILRVPVVGWIIGNICVAVDRSSKESRKQSLLDMVAELEGGVSILVFPEGTRNRSDAPLADFHPGAFLAAIKAGVPIMPVVITGIRPLQPVGTFQFYPGRATMTFLPPISTADMVDTDIRGLTRKVFDHMQTEIIRRDPAFQQVGMTG